MTCRMSVMKGIPRNTVAYAAHTQITQVHDFESILEFWVTQCFTARLVGVIVCVRACVRV